MPVRVDSSYGVLTAAGMEPITLLASAARTAATDSADISNTGYRGVHVYLDVTVDPAAAAITVTIQGKDPISGKYYTLLAGAAVSAVGTTVYKIFPGATAAANAVANDCVPTTWRVSVAVADADSMTYSITASPLL